MNIHGWECIIPQLAAYFVVLRRRKEELTPFNLFVTGPAGTNKTRGTGELTKHLKLSSALIDASTLDDVAELAGVVNLHANRTLGQAAVIEGDLLKEEILILDEFLNVRPHVLPQFRLLLQGHLVLLGKKHPIKTRAIVGTGNLTENMQQGEANVLDSPTADRFAMVIEVPSMSKMNTQDVMGILLRKPGARFAAAFDKAVVTMEEHYEDLAAKKLMQVMTYVRALVRELAGTTCSFEGRRAQLLMDFVVAALALCKGDASLSEKEVVWQVARDALSYHKLSGLEIDYALLRTKHEEAYDLAFADNAIEALISGEPDLSAKIAIMLANLDVVNPITKTDLLRLIAESTDISIKLAAKDLIVSPLLANEPPALKELIEKLDLSAGATAVPLKPAQLKELSKMSPSQILVFGLAGADHQKMKEINAQVEAHLISWGVQKPVA